MDPGAQDPAVVSPIDYGGGHACAGDDGPLVLLASPRGFCAGVRRAIRIVELTCAQNEGPTYVRHEIVHNRTVIRELEQKGAIFVEQLDEVPRHATVIFSAHGVSSGVRRDARQRSLDSIDATCPLVTKVHRAVTAHAAQGRHIFLIGHAGHPEVEGTLGQVAPGAITLVQSPAEVEALPARDGPLAFAMQTTLSGDEAGGVVAALRRRWPDIAGSEGDDICYATTNRQNAVKSLATRVAAILVVGSSNSSNSRRLQETAERAGVPAQLIEDEQMIDWAALRGTSRIGITAGASAPESIVQRVAAQVAASLGGCPIVETAGPAEPAMFTLPQRLRGAGRFAAGS